MLCLIYSVLALCFHSYLPAKKPSSAQSSLPEIPVFINGQDGYNCYRIPAIVKAPSGELLAFAEGRKKDCGDFGDVDLVLRTSRDHGKTWSPLQKIVDFGEAQAGNPAPVFDLTDPRYPQGRLLLVYNTGTASEHDVRMGKAIREIWYMTSTDAGKTWSSPVNITTQVSRPNHVATNARYTFSEDWRSYATTPGHALQIQNGRYRGRLFIAANHSEGPPQEHFADYKAHGFYSDDHGKSWKLSPNVSYPGGNESTAAETSTGGVLMNIRNQSGDVKARLQAFSSNAGEAWTSVRVVHELRDPVCQGSLINYRSPGSRPVLLFSNLNHADNRENLTVRVSDDDGQTWSTGKTIDTGSAAYSDIVVQGEGQVGVLYEKDDYTKITYTYFPYSYLTTK